MERVLIRPGLFTLDPPRLLGGHCRQCDRWHFPSQATCPYCASRCEVSPLAERGTLCLYTVVNNAPPGYRGVTPYGLGVVELPEGLRIISPLTESDLGALCIGMSLRLRIAPLFTDDEGREVMSFAFAPSVTEVR